MMSMQYSSPGDIYTTGGNYQATGMNGSYYTGGSIPPGSNYMNCSPMTGSNGFTFRKRYERVDWKKIAAADVDQISRDLDFNTLQENIMNITFCNIESELDVGKIDPHFVKLFKLSQLTIEYLLHSQDYLSSLLSTMEEKMKCLVEERAEAQKLVENHKSELAEVKKESHKRKKMLIAQQQIMNAGINSYHKCPFCAKAFVNQTFLQSHLQRRHTEHGSHTLTVSQIQNQTVSPPVSQPQQTLDQSQGQVSDEQRKLMEKELDEIKERLKITESHLIEERNARNSISRQEKEEAAKRERQLQMEMEEWKKEQIGAQKKDTERMREMFMKELKEMNEKYNSATKALESLQRKGRSNLGAMHDENENDREQLLRQREEVAMLKEQLEAKMKDVQLDMQAKFDTQEKKWKEKVKELNRKHNGELSKLNATYEENIQDIRDDKKQRDKRESEYQRKMRDMEEAIKPAVASRPPIQKDEVQSIKRQSEAPRPMSPTEHDSEDDSDDSDDDDDVSSAAGTTLGTTGLQTGLSNIGMDTLSLGTGTLNSVAVRLLAEVKQDPNLLQAMREEIKSVLDENLSKRGIPATATGISNSVYTDKMHMLKLERQAQQKKHSNFYDIRQQYIRQIDDLAREKMKKKGVKGSKPKPGSREDPKPPRPVSPNRPISPSRPPKSAPRPAPRATSPQGKLMSTMSTMSSTGTYATTTGSQSSWGTQEASSSHWDSDADSDEETAITDRKTPTPRSRAKPAHDEDEDEESDWDDGSELEPTPRSPVRSIPSTPQPRGQKVAQLRDKIEYQLAGRGKKPAGGVDSVGADEEKSGKKRKDESWDDDDDDDFSVSSLEETASAPPTRNNSMQRKANTPTDLSTGTSQWGGSSKDKNRPQPSPRRTGVQASRSSFNSGTM